MKADPTENGPESKTAKVILAASELLKTRMVVYYDGSDLVFVKASKRFVQTDRFQLHQGRVMLNNCSRWSWSLKKSVVINVN